MKTVSLSKWFYRLVLGILKWYGFRGTDAPQGVLIYKPDRIGDFVLSTGVLRSLASTLDRGQQVTLVVAHLVGPLARREFPQWRIIEVPLGADTLRGGLIVDWFKTREALGNHHFTTILVLRHHLSLFEDLVLCCLRGARTFGIVDGPLTRDGWMASCRAFRPTEFAQYPTESAPGSCRELEAHHRLLELVTVKGASSASILPELASFETKEGDNLLILPHGSASIRNYPTHLIVSAVCLLELPQKVQVVVSGEARLAGELEQLASELRNALPNAVKVELPSNLVALCELVAGAGMVLAMESAGAHIGTALNKRCVAVVGGGHFGFCAPWSRSNMQQWVFRKLDCFGCNWLCSHPRPICIQDLDPITVAGALKSCKPRAWGGAVCEHS